ncbi:unnamed protein product [Cuscuta epithymum]|uniref:DUF4378 domain-containing protein n=1 Tax=Cuscuta epithymum TaxID=186058 RepID=A0AAV0G546_9ASTE|nr:unnamed protein product [Cuscuta epithymum]
MEAPPNSLNLPMEVSQRQRLSHSGNNKLCTYQMTANRWSGKRNCPNELPMKKLTNEETCRRPNKGPNAPSVIARLMGVDMLPVLDSKPIARQKNIEAKMSSPSKEEEVRDIPVDPSTLITTRSCRFSSFHYYDECCDPSMELVKPKPRREHPQEEELQKFKKEFEAWQAKKTDTLYLKSTSSKKQFKETVLTDNSKKHETSPVNIVVLRPCFDDNETIYGSRESSPSISEERGNSMDDFLEEVNARLRNETSPYNHDHDKLESEVPTRSLIRSLSTPISRTSFGCLLLEERGDLNGIKKISLSADHNKRKQKFSLMEKVSSFKTKLFSKKLQNESHGTKYIRNASDTSPSYDMNEDYTEVPPSPASVCNSFGEEFWRPGDCSRTSSPASTPDLHPLVETDIPRVFREINSNLTELRRQLNELETGENVIDQQPTLEEEMVEIHDTAKAYLRDLLIASGLYDGDKYPWRWDTFGKPISNHIFEGVEESYGKKAEGSEGERLNHKMLCDLFNETVLNLLRAPSKEAICPVTYPPQGRKLLDCVWEMTQTHIYPGEDLSYCSIQDIVSYSLRSTPWSSDEDANAIGKDVECHITRDLIQEIIEDMQPLS